jgi:OOP family OmpA-OmpF porin
MAKGSAYMTLSIGNKLSPKLLTLSFLLFACSGKEVAEAPNTALSPEITAAQTSLVEAQNAQVDIFAPANFKKATSSLAKAREKSSKNAPTSEIAEELSRSREALATAQKKADIAKAALPGVAEARDYALRVDARRLYGEDLGDVDEELVDITADAEEGEIKNADKEVHQLVNDYRALEARSVVKTKLESTDKKLDSLKDQNAKKYAPKSLKAADDSYAEAERVISSDPRNVAAVAAAVDRANYAAGRLERVMAKTKNAGGAKAEDIALASEAQAEASHQRELAMNPAQQAKELQEKVATIQTKFDDDEAEVYQQGANVIVRLKGIKFPHNGAEIPSTSFETLKKVQESIQAFQAPHVEIQGHTDSTGGSKVNLPLSEKRAEAVRNYLTANLPLQAESVEVKGLGSSRPIATNKTAKGREQNRRIDIVISQGQKEENKTSQEGAM